MLVLSNILNPQVLTDPDHCYCVLLNAHDGAAFPNERKTEQANSEANSEVSSSENVTSHGKTKNSKVVLENVNNCFPKDNSTSSDN